MASGNDFVVVTSDFPSPRSKELKRAPLLRYLGRASTDHAHLCQLLEFLEGEQRIEIVSHCTTVIRGRNCHVVWQVRPVHTNTPRLGAALLTTTNDMDL